MEEVSVETDHGLKFIYILSCDKVSSSLMDITTPQNALAKFYNGQSLTDFARNLLIDLFTVIYNFIETPVDVSVSSDNIFLVDNQFDSLPIEWTAWHLADYKMRHPTSFILPRVQAIT